MGQWGMATYSGDSVMDFLQHHPIAGELNRFNQEIADLTIKDVWRSGSDFDRLGVVVWLITHGFTVPLNRLQNAMEYATMQLRPSILNDWGNPEERKAMLAIEMGDIQYAIENGGTSKERDEATLHEEMAKAIGPHVEIKDGEKHIALPCFGIKVVVIEPDPDSTLRERWLGGSITSDAKEVCEHCKDADCEMDCSDFKEYCTDRDIDMFHAKEAERDGFVAFNGGVDALTSMILAHAMAGLSIEEPAYIEGIETAMQALGNNT